MERNLNSNFSHYLLYLKINKKTTTYLWCSGHSIGISVCEIWGVKFGFQDFKKIFLGKKKKKHYNG